MNDIEKQLAFKDRRIETLEAIALDRNLVDDAGWWGRFASHLCTEKDKLKLQLEAEMEKVSTRDAALRNGILQIEYLEKKFNAGTGSGEQVKAQMVAALQVYDEGEL